MHFVDFFRTFLGFLGLLGRFDKHKRFGRSIDAYAKNWHMLFGRGRAPYIFGDTDCEAGCGLNIIPRSWLFQALNPP